MSPGLRSLRDPHGSQAYSLSPALWQGAAKRGWWPHTSYGVLRRAHKPGREMWPCILPPLGMDKLLFRKDRVCRAHMGRVAWALTSFNQWWPDGKHLCKAGQEPRAVLRTPGPRITWQVEEVPALVLVLLLTNWSSLPNEVYTREAKGPHRNSWCPRLQDVCFPKLKSPSSWLDNAFSFSDLKIY